MEMLVISLNQGILILLIVDITRHAASSIAPEKHTPTYHTEDSFITRILLENAKLCNDVCDTDRVKALLGATHNNKTDAICNVMSRCGYCKCDAKCFLYKDCCVDKVLLTQNNDDYADMTTVCRKVMTRMETIYLNMVSSCGRHYQDADDICKCLNPDDFSPTEFTPVVNPHTGDTYMNIFCASCNGVPDTIPFQMRMECSQFVDFSNFSSSLELFVGFQNKSLPTDLGCSISFDLPDIRQGYRTCEQNWGSTCEIVDSVDPLHRGTCEKLHFSNVHFTARNELCYRCSTGMLPVNCSIEHLHVVRSPFLIPLSIILDFGAETDPHGSERCGAGQRYDNKMKECRKLFCVQGKRLTSREACVSTFAAMSGRVYVVVAVITHSRNLTFASKSILPYQIATTLLQDLKKRITAVVENSSVGLEGELFSITPSLIQIEAECVERLCKMKNIILGARVSVVNLHNVDELEKGLYHAMSKKWIFRSDSIALDFRMGTVVRNFNWNQFPINSKPKNLFTVSGKKRQRTYQLLDYYEPNAIVNSSLELIDHFKPTEISAFLFCSHVLLNESWFVLFDNNSLFVNATEKIVPSGSFEEISNGTVGVCVNYAISNFSMDDQWYHSWFDITQGYMSLILICVSIVCLMITTLTYCLFKAMRTLPGKLNMSLAISLMVAQGLFQFGVGQTKYPDFCMVLGILIHYAWLCTFCWMNVCSIHMAKVFVHSDQISKLTNSNRTLMVYCAHAFLTPAVIVAVTLIINSTSTPDSLGYGGSFCFISSSHLITWTLALPLGIILVTNCLCLAFSIRGIRRGRDLYVSSQVERNYMSTYFKLSSVTGLTWLFGFLANILALRALWYPFIVLNAGQGILVFFSFIFNRRVLKLYENTWGCHCPCSINTNRSVSRGSEKTESTKV